MGDRCAKLADHHHAMPWLVPESQKLELIFFQKVFNRLRRSSDVLQDEQPGVPLLVFRRAMSRLLRLLQDERSFDAMDYDIDQDGTVGWWEFCILWKKEALAVQLSTAERIYLTLEDPQASRLGRIISIVVLMAICVSAGSFIVSTEPGMQHIPCPTCEPVPLDVFSNIDMFCVILFTIEYCMRLVTASSMRMELLNQDELIRRICTDEMIRWPTKLRRTWDFVKAWPNVIDLASILPSYIAWIVESTSTEESTSGGGTAIFFRLLRLMRVVRAFRLGRRFEAVIIIARSMQRSVRALWVLVLNLSLGMIIFGAIMYFMEHGTYNVELGYYERTEGYQLNPVTDRYELVMGQSPFESIPHCFWWALVTATTTGYGDHSPTTVPGKIAAGLAMVWSICVIALPVGVIGATFENVWREYDNEKKIERKFKASEESMVKVTLGSIDPITYSKQLHLEVYHDSRMPTKENDVFIGEAEVVLDIRGGDERTVYRELTVPLRENRDKSNRKASGELILSYTFYPSPPSDEATLLEGELQVTLLRAENLSPVDWKDSGLCDPYVVLTLYPNSPSVEDGIIEPRVERFSTSVDQFTPTWNETMSVAFHWKTAGVHAKKAKDKKKCRRDSVKIPVEDEERLLIDTVPLLTSEIMELKRVMPELQNEILELRKNTSSILTHLGILPTQGTPTDRSWGNEVTVTLASPRSDHWVATAEATTSPVKLCQTTPAQDFVQPKSQAERKPIKSHGGDGDGFLALVPGAVPEGASSPDPKSLR